MASELQTSLLTKFYCIDRTPFPVLIHPFNNLGSFDAAVSLMWAYASHPYLFPPNHPLVAQPCLSLDSLHLPLFPHPQHLWLFCFQPTLYCGKMYSLLRFQGLPCNSLWTLFLSLTPVDSVGWGQGLLPTFFPKPLFLQLVSPRLHNDPTMLSISKGPRATPYLSYSFLVYHTQEFISFSKLFLCMPTSHLDACLSFSYFEHIVHSTYGLFNVKVNFDRERKRKKKNKKKGEGRKGRGEEKNKEEEGKKAKSKVCLLTGISSDSSA